MATTTAFNGQRNRPARNVRYLLASTAALLVWYGFNFWPGWQAIPVLTPDTFQFMSLVNLWLLAAAVSNAVYIVFDAKWFKSAWQVAVTTISLAVAAQAYTVFPFDFSILYYYDVRWIARTALILAIAGGLVRLVVVTIRFVRAATRAIDDLRWTRRLKATLDARAQLTGIPNPLTVVAGAQAGPIANRESWGLTRTAPEDSTDDWYEAPEATMDSDTAEAGIAPEPVPESDFVPETAPAPASAFVPEPALVPETVAEPAPTPVAAPAAGGETRRSRRAHAASSTPEPIVAQEARTRPGSHRANA